ncbi:hypothetical protein [Rhodospirillum centenum]|uniref:Lipoprotein n=1 Tax=Rhodospirillum centenum (strain ATCC 51521 / SW) TaxID=414684 RepID=B6IQY3_RHOCS|nr:hypothetical protein [Rhodospirillum centenum]ACI97869.1 hypothetical protein RC1_0430 [Rhodospirillum centenum SW]
MRPRQIALAALLPVLLTACMAPPARREAQGATDGHQACLAQCNREADVCFDQRSAQDGNTTYGMGATCQAEMKSCLNRCGGR